MKKTITQDISKVFPSVTAFETYLKNGKTQEKFQEWSSKNSKSFTHTNSYEEANDYLLYGDRALAKKIEAAGVAKIRQQLNSHKFQRKTFTDVVGFMPHVPNFVAGVPLNMINVKKIAQPIKSINLVYSTSAPCTTSTTDMIFAAANVLAAIMKIENNGTRINLFTGIFTTDRFETKQNVAGIVKIKSSDKKLDVLKCAYPLVSPSMLRRHLFRFIEVTPGVSKGFIQDYGGVIKDVKKVGDLIAKGGIKNPVIITFTEIEGMEREDVEKLIIQKAKEATGRK